MMSHLDKKCKEIIQARTNVEETGIQENECN